MSQTFEPSVIRILGRDGSTVGAGFVVAENLAVTNAHVVESAGSAPGGSVRLIFHLTGDETIAQVNEKYWRPKDTEDVAFLFLEGILPEGISMALLGSSHGLEQQPFKTIGFPSANPQGSVLGDGHIVGDTHLNNIRVLQLSSPQITPGFSGAPIWSTLKRRVVGMITSITLPDHGRLTDTVFITPTETLLEICRDLQLSDICPYRGLEAFREVDVEFFFGREAMIERLLDSLRRQPRFLAVLGPSGSGKSSLVQAGLIPELRRGKVPNSEHWIFLHQNRPSRPAELLQDQFRAHGIEAVNNVITTYKERLYESLGQQKHLILVIDQFEELLIMESEVIHAYIELLTTLLDSSTEITIVIAMRSDFYGILAQKAQGILPWFERGLVNITDAILPEELRAIIEKPASAVGIDLEPGLTDRIIQEILTASPDGQVGKGTILPLLEFTLELLWDNRQEGLLTHDAYNNIGGVTGGLVHWAEQTYLSFPEDLRPRVRHILTSLVHLGNEDQGIPDSRQIRPLNNIVHNDADRSVVEKLASARLIVTTHDSVHGIETVELIHDALLRERQLISFWLDEDRNFLLWRKNVEERTLSWNRKKKERSELLHGKSLSEAEIWLRNRRGDIGKDEQKFIQASKDNRRREHNRLVLILLAGVLGIIAITSLALTGRLNRLIYKPLPLEWVTIQAGKFIMGNQETDLSANPDQFPQHEVYLDSFQMMKYEVTNHQYERCVRSGTCRPPSSTRYNDTNYSSHPVVFINWEDARIFCEWSKARLPSEAEWEKAARGGLANKFYPWGDEEPDCSRVNYRGRQERCINDTSPVGSYPSNSFGLHDMAGNVWEWVSDYYDADYYIFSPTLNPTGPALGYYRDRVIRGGGWDSDNINIRVTYRRGINPDELNIIIGFRCAR